MSSKLNKVRVHSQKDTMLEYGQKSVSSQTQTDRHTGWGRGGGGTHVWEQQASLVLF